MAGQTKHWEISLAITLIPGLPREFEEVNIYRWIGDGK
jgi:hypothetical protein